jgi:hypothetical protein
MTTPVEVQGLLTKSGQVTLDSTGNGVLTFDPDNASQRWEITSVTVATNQTSLATTVPVATLAVNTVSMKTMSAGNQRGASWSGNSDTFMGKIDVGPADFFAVLFSPPQGAAGAPMAGVIASAVVTGSKFTRRS